MATEARAIQRTTRQSPYKMRLVIDQIRGKMVNDALALLKFSKKHAAVQIAKTLESAVANAEQAARAANTSLDVDALFDEEGHRQRGAEAQAVDAGRDGAGDAGPQAHQPRRDRRGGEGRCANGTEDESDRLPPRDHEAVALDAGTPRSEFPQLLKEDALLRKYLKTRLGHAAIADVHIERKPGKVVVTIHTGRPGVVIGKKGAEVDKLRDELAQLTGKEVGINVEEIKRPSSTRSWWPTTSRTSWPSVSRSAAR
jgi:predicted RNA-binding protein Jag